MHFYTPQNENDTIMIRGFSGEEKSRFWWYMPHKNVAVRNRALQKHEEDCNIDFVMV